jgi:SAM-dependent methyltransferase
MEKQAYSLFARYYDEYMAHVEYDSWVDFILGRYSRKHKKSPGRVLELACGTGNIANRLVRRGCEVDGTDISEAMLHIARTKPFAANFNQANMLDPIESGKYDLILLLFDSLNYLRKPEEINVLLKNVGNSLSKQGMFIFDISTIRNCRDNFDGFINIEDNEKGFVIHESEFDKEKLLQTNHITFFIPQDKLFQRFDEYHLQKIYPVKKIIEFIENSCFRLMGVYRLADEKNQKLLPEDYIYADKIHDRVFFVVELENA